MRLGIVGMLPGDLRTHTQSHFEAITDLGFTGAGFHFPGHMTAEIEAADIRRSLNLFSEHQLDLAQLAVTYRECLFDREAATRAAVIDTIVRTAQIASDLRAQYYLIRPGSLNPQGSWTPHRDNHTDESWKLLTDSMSQVARGLEGLGVTAVVETHSVSILRDPETCKEMIDQINSPHIRLVMDYVNHFESLKQVYASRKRLDRIFDAVGTASPILHVKDICIGRGLVIHIDEAIPGEGELDLVHCLQRFEALHPAGYALIEHLKIDDIPTAAINTRKLLAEAGIQSPT